MQKKNADAKDAIAARQSELRFATIIGIASAIGALFSMVALFGFPGAVLFVSLMGLRISYELMVEALNRIKAIKSEAAFGELMNKLSETMKEKKNGTADSK